MTVSSDKHDHQPPGAQALALFKLSIQNALHLTAVRALPGTSAYGAAMADQLARGIAKIRPEKSLGTRNAVKTSEPLS